MKSIEEKTALVTGSAGFIGFHISKKLLDKGWKVIGLDCMSDYYDVSLKEKRENILNQNSRYSSIHKKIEADNVLMNLFAKERPSIVIHLAAQAGVRYSIEDPRVYLESNIIGTFELLEAARCYPPEHMLLASTSSAYGANDNMPYAENMQSDHQMSFYAATKKSTENMAHSYSHLFNLPITVFRFFTVYGPWGRPDMAIFKFTEAILSGDTIDVYNFGEMYRDFTYIDDLINGMNLLIDKVPETGGENKKNYQTDHNSSPVAPFRLVNIGNSKSEKLTDFIEALEKALGMTAIKNFLPMQPGDVPATLASTDLLKSLTGYRPQTDIASGVNSFVKWYRNYYEII